MLTFPNFRQLIRRKTWRKTFGILLSLLILFALAMEVLVCSINTIVRSAVSPYSGVIDELFHFLQGLSTGRYDFGFFTVK
jgi:cell shape-determining protein MreC